MAGTRRCPPREGRLVMVWYPSSELLLDPAPPRVADTLPGQLARGAARGALAARRSDPRPFAGRSPARGGLILGLALEAWDLFTSEPQPSGITAIALPPLGLSQPYEVTVTATSISTNPIDPQPQTQTFGPFVLFGGLGTAAIATRTAGNAVYIREGVGTPFEVETRITDGFNLALRRWRSIDSLVVTPQGQPDQRIPGLYPYPRSPEEPDYPDDVPLDVPLPAIPGYLPTPVIIPIIIPTPSDLGRRPVPILYPPGLTPDQRRGLPQGWFLPEGIQMGRGSADDRVGSSTGDSADTTIIVDLGSDYTIRNPPTVTDCLEVPEPPGECCDCDDIRTIVIEELDSKFPPSRPNELVVSEIFPTQAGEIVLPAFAQWVEVDIIVPPPNRRTQSGGASGIPVFYNGWISFGATNSASERIALHYDSTSWPVPDGASAFSWTIYDGGTAKISVGRLRETI